MTGFLGPVRDGVGLDGIGLDWIDGIELDIDFEIVVSN